MRDQMLNTTRPEVFKKVGFVMLALGLMLISGCKELERQDTDGASINGIMLPTDTLLNLSCVNMGINSEQCVLDDPDNPFRTALIREFDVNNPDGETKFDLLDQIPTGPQYAKARVYFWATALARRASGENQWYAARAFHELYDINDDPVIQAQALSAYRSVLDNFYDSVTFFPPFGSFPLRNLAAEDVYGTGVELVPLVGQVDNAGNNVPAANLLSEWGYSYVDGVLTINGG